MESPLETTDLRRAHRVIAVMSLIASRTDPETAKIARKILPLMSPEDRASVLLSTAVLEDSELCDTDKQFEETIVDIPNPITFHDLSRLASLVEVCDPHRHLAGNSSEKNERERNATQIAASALGTLGFQYTLHGLNGIRVARQPFLTACAEAWSLLPNKTLFEYVLGPKFAREVRKDAYIRLGVQSTRDIRRCFELLLVFLGLFLLTGIFLGRLLTGMNS